MVQIPQWQVWNQHGGKKQESQEWKLGVRVGVNGEGGEESLDRSSVFTFANPQTGDIYQVQVPVKEYSTHAKRPLPFFRNNVLNWGKPQRLTRQSKKQSCTQSILRMSFPGIVHPTLLPCLHKLRATQEKSLFLWLSLSWEAPCCLHQRCYVY